MMRLEGILLSFNNLLMNKMRSLLTMLGVIIGVVSIVLLVSVVAGTRARIESEIESIGSNVFMVVPGNLEGTFGPPGNFTVNRFTLRHVDLIESLNTYGARAMPLSIVTGGTVKYRSESRSTTNIGGVTENFQYVRNWNVEYGSFFRKEDVDAARSVAVVGRAIVDDFFGGASPVGKDIIVVGRRVRVIGVIESKGRQFGQNLDDIVIMPITTAHNITGATTINQILVKVPDAGDVDGAVAEVKRILGRDIDSEDFSVRSQAELLSMFNSFAGILTVVMGCVAGISLFVGGIGIMNIMLVTVKERTREIGIRKAVGATFRDILTQFLSESFVIAVAGGLIGIILAVAIIAVAGRFLPFPLKVSVPSMLIAFFFSSLTGVFFGTYPAVKAARVDPIIALRYE